MESQKVNSRSQALLGNQMIWLPYFDSLDFLRVHHFSPFFPLTGSLYLSKQLVMPMSKYILYEGRYYTIELAQTREGRCPGQDFLDNLTEAERARILRIIQRLADFGKITNREQFKKIADDFYEFKNYQTRMPCYYIKNRVIIITHGFVKKRDEIDDNEL